MIMDTPFVVRIIIIGSCFSTILNLLILGVSQHARRWLGGKLPLWREQDWQPHSVHPEPRWHDLQSPRLCLCRPPSQVSVSDVDHLTSWPRDLRMSDPRTPGCDSEVNEFAQHGGITNGAAWYSVPGGMQVWHQQKYRHLNLNLNSTPFLRTLTTSHRMILRSPWSLVVTSIPPPRG